MRFLLITTLLLASHQSIAMDIEVNALFGGAAVLIIDGESQLLKEGDISPQGVRLLEADSRQAVILVAGEKMTLHLSEHITSRFAAAEEATVQIAMQENRRYLTPGTINGRSVSFLVDTGANVVAISAGMAASLGINLDSAITVNAATASSDVPVKLVNLKEVTVGPITRNNVEAVILEGNNPREPLLGMSFLQHVDITETSGLMTLKSKY